MIPDVAILVPATTPCSSRIQVSMPMWIHRVITTQQTSESPDDNGIIKNLLNFGNPGKEIIANVSFPFYRFIKFSANLLVQGRWGTALYEQIPISNELLYIHIAQEIF